MPIDVAAATSAEPRSAELVWDHRDVILYHLGLGANTLNYALEGPGLQVLPSFATVAGGSAAAGEARGGLSLPGIEVDLAAVLHGAQRIEVHRPVPVRGRAVQTSRVADVYDKGKAAVLVLRREVADEQGPLWTSDAQIFVRGEGGFGGDRGPSARTTPPGTAPDRTVLRATREDQALLYRLSGDWNPLHADPEFAKHAGFDRPILHGLCSYGITLKAVVETLLGDDAGRVRSCSTRFAGVFFPGETLCIRMWSEPGRVLASATAVERDDAPVLADTVVEHS
ncbi:MaoC/PaaZ C-terminal domain-containing protein [Actinacidiphila glaucinigra]|uniref:Acyl dehydratase n=1 Tax=Actinacidiphila glaucinigra TaxID=235986 RepID=A0A238ZG88_9ACTN|nr:MaoC/PaaZ C-terminal domain-containing protein [Actinacidiphila glaucinigra]SNR82142.1 Acyl dehydratase [Actinacidiphila glaucinigra]